MASPHILITTGGTGGHIFPALAVIEQIREQSPDARILFVGSNHGPEAQLAAKAGVEFLGLNVKGVLGRGVRAVFALVDMVKAINTARTVIKRFQPNVVAGFGSYASFPSLFAAKLAGVPIVIHEQNAIPGLSNRLMGKLASRIYLSMPDRLQKFDPAKTTLVGNPVRGAIASLAPRSASADQRPHLLVMGGSQGARSINTAILEALPELTDIFIHHQAGKADYERVRDAYAEAGVSTDRALVEPFISDMGTAYAKADLIVSRSGASTIAELALAGKPAIFIPFPYATHDHQTANARTMEEAGAARLIPASELTPHRLASMIHELTSDRVQLAAMGEAAQKLATPDAARHVANGILDFAQ